MLSRRLLQQRATPLALAGLAWHRPSAAAVGLAARVGSLRGLHATGPASSRDLYEVLGLPKTASSGEIKRKYYEKAKAHHPDTNKGDPEAAKKFAEATEAYEVLSDPEKRKAYDSYGHAGLNGGAGEGARGPGGFGAGPGGFQWQFRGGSPNEVDFDDLLSQLFGGDNRRAQRGPRRGRDVQVRRQAPCLII
jgi:DnaJ-class molecular chaperone